MSRQIRDIVKIDENLCDGCGLCIPGCAEGAIEIHEGKARLVADKYCDGLGACLGHCPKGAITMIKREADSFDEEAVEERLHQLETARETVPKTLGCGCPGTAMATFAPAKDALEAKTGPAAPSALTHWPVQIRLIPPHAPFLKGADLLVAADCAPAAYPGLHQELLPGKVIMLGCPKFDDPRDYVERFAEIFRQAGIKSVTVLSMEVPCCAGLAQIVRQAMSLSGRNIPFKEIKVSRQGELLPEAEDVHSLSGAFQPVHQQLLNL
jgi:Pyruvate/2-oxoacid:ferredoxin oxidoreductase delta subunit